MKLRLLRRIALALGVLLLLLVATVAVLVATFDANRYKSVAIDWMKNEHQRTLAIDGPIELSVFPRLAVRLSGVRLSERGKSDEFAAIDRASLAVQLMPLLRKQLVIDRVSASGVRATWLRDANNVRNIDDFVGASQAAAPASPAPGAGAPPSPASPSSSALRFDVGGVQLDDVRLGVRDDAADVAGDIVLRSFTSGRITGQGQSPVSLSASAQLTRPKPATLSADGTATVALDLARNAVSLDALSLDVTGDVADAKGLAVTLTGQLGWDGKAVRAGPLKVALKSVAIGPAALGPSTLDVKRALFDPEGRQLELEALALSAAGRRAEDSFKLSLDWPRLKVNANELEGSALQGRFELTGATSLAGTFQSAAPSGQFDALRLPGTAVTLAGQSGPRKIDGRAQTDIVLDADRRAARLEAIAVDVALVDPGLQPVQLTIRGQADASAGHAHWTLDGSLNTNRFSSAGQAAFAGAVPDIQAEARFDSLDLNELLAPPGGAKPTTPASPVPAAPANAPAPAESPVQLAGLKALDGKFTLTAGTLAFRQYRVADARVDAAIASGTLTVSRLEGKAWGGTIQGSGSAAADSQRIAVKLAASGVDIDALLKNVAGKDLLEGTGRVTADVATTGATVGALRSNLGGTVALQLRNGAVKGINLARAFRQAQAALTQKQDAVSAAKTTEKTDFTELSASAQIANGVARSNDLDVKSPFLRIGGDGRFDIGRGRIDYTARATLIGAPTGQGGAELAALKGITVPVALSGPFEAIDWKIQWSAVAGSVIEKQLKDRLADRLARELGVPPAGKDGSPPAAPIDDLKNRLKGLFR
ncbi:MAG: AsmA family protein [Gammaproteobacteria bacterium]|nr:AsmA family protein [Gammaproteobacteria bacterium]